MRGLDDILARVRYDHGCWLWTGALTSGGYGSTTLDGKWSSVHRAVLRLTGARVDGDVDHLCRNRACCNPLHLDVVSSRENTIRGATLAAENAAKTHCPRGHEYAGSNVVFRSGKRVCRACMNARRREMRRGSSSAADRHRDKARERYRAIMRDPEAHDRAKRLMAEAHLRRKAARQ